jgi:hypothetical protein
MAQPGIIRISLTRGQTVLGCCLLLPLWASPAAAQEPLDLIFADGFESCPPETGECDGDPETICETPLDTNMDCGACAVVCDLPNASEVCNAGTCTFMGCSAGFATCDGSEANGCEVQLSGHSNSYPGEYLGSYDADTASCPLVLSRSSTRGAFFYVDAREAVLATATLKLKFVLLVPADIDYDLSVSAPLSTGCASSCSSNDPPGQPENVVVHRMDGSGDHSFTAYAEVRFSSGTSCQPWTLNVYAGTGCMED